MKPRRGAAIDPAHLRQEAERLADALPEQPADRDALKQWHELQVSQIELEMQNAALNELQRLKDEAEQDRDSYTQMYDLAPASYFSIDRRGVILRANRAAAVLLGVPCATLHGQGFERYVAPADQPGFRRFIASVYASGARTVLEAELFGAVAGARRIRIEANLDRATDVCRMIVSDMSDWHARETALRRAFVVLDSIGEGVVVTDSDNRIISVNPAFSSITGYAAEEVIGLDPTYFGRGQQPPEFYNEVWHQLVQHGSWQGEVLNRRRDGVAFVAWSSGNVMRGEDGGIGNFVYVFSDITQRKVAEQRLRELYLQLEDRVESRTSDLTRANALLQQEIAERQKAELALRDSHAQLRLLAEHLATVKENERKRIARELHDELGQNLLALRIDVSMLRARTEKSHPRLHKRVDAALGNVDTTIRSVRSIMNQLRPSVLDLGLQAALEWQLGDFRKRSGLACHLTVPDEQVYERLDGEAGVVLFRILQESLINVQRHANASVVDVLLMVEDSCVVLSVVDDGVGIAPEQRRKPNSFGLIGIAERVGALGGAFEIDTYRPGRGCRLTMRIPIPPQLGETACFVV